MSPLHCSLAYLSEEKNISGHASFKVNFNEHSHLSIYIGKLIDTFACKTPLYLVLVCVCVCARAHVRACVSSFELSL